MKLSTVLLSTLYFCYTHAFLYEIELNEHVTGSSVGVSYNTYAGSYPFVVDIPENETNCAAQQEIGSAHDDSCAISSVVLGAEEDIQLLITGTIGESNQTEDVCINNGGFACVGAFFESESFLAKAADTVYYTYDASVVAGDNYYEFLVLLVDASNDIPVWGMGRRGIASSGTMSYSIAADGEYYLRFYVGGYLYASSSLPRTLEPSVTFSTIQIDNAESRAPTDAPTNSPSATPSVSPSKTPTTSPTPLPTTSPSSTPTNAPSTSPTDAPTTSPTITQCDIGRYRDVNNTNDCLPCPLNTFSDVVNSLECTACPPGYFTDSVGSITCIESRYTRTSHIPRAATIPTICNETRAALVADDIVEFNNLLANELSPGDAATCIRSLYLPFIKRSSSEEPGDTWGAPANRVFASGLLRSQETGSNSLSLGARARLVEIAKPGAEVDNIEVPCVCDSESETTCLKKLYFTSDDPFSITPVPQWVEYRSGQLVACNNSLTIVEVQFLPFEGGFNRRRLQFGSDDPIHGSNSNDQTEAPTTSPTTAPTKSPSITPTSSPTPLPTNQPINNSTNSPTVVPRAEAQAQPFETSILAIMLYTMAAIVFIGIFAYVAYTFYMLSQESSVQGIGEAADLPQIVNEFIERFQAP